MLELPGLTFTVAFDGANSYGQCNVPADLTNAVAIAAGAYFSLALTNGKVVAWGDNAYGETTIPAGLSNVTAIAAGYYHGVALLANGSVTNWGSYYDDYLGTNYFCSVTNRAYASPPPLSNVVAVAAGEGQDLALLSNGTCVAWGFTNVYGTGAAYGTMVPTNLNLTNVSSIACGWDFNVALSSNGAVKAWGQEYNGIYNLTNVPADLNSNVVAIAAGGFSSMALRENGTVEAWGDPSSGVTNVPGGLSNVVAVATGGAAGLALQADGNLVAWGFSALVGIPTGMVGVKAISSGFDHNMVLESGLLDPVLFTEPTAQYALAGGSVTFTATGAGVAGVTYQWQSNNVNVIGATNSTLSLTNVSASYNANYDVVVTSDGFSITSSAAPFALVVAPVITSTTPTNALTTWFNYDPILSLSAFSIDPTDFPLTYGWKFNGTNIAGATTANYTIPNLTATNEGSYSIGVTNAAGSTSATWNMVLALPGMVEAWGDNTYGECTRPISVTNISAIAAGEYQSVAVTDSGTVYQWGQYWNGNYYSVTNSLVATLPPTNALLGVSAGIDHVLGLTTSNTVVSWGLTNSVANYVATNLSLTNVSQIGAGWAFNVALRSTGTVAAWGENLFGQTNVPAGLTNVTAIAAGAEHALALSNGYVVAWGYNGSGQTSLPAGLSNVVAIAAGDENSMALTSNGNVIVWGSNTYGQTNVPAGVNGNTMGIAAGSGHCVALLNNGTVMAWGDNAEGQTNAFGQLPNVVVSVSGSPPNFTTNTYQSTATKLIAAGGNHTMAAMFSSFVQYPVNVSKDLLLIYNTNSIDSSNVCYYYRTHRPMVGSANVLGIGVTTNDPISISGFTTDFQPQVQAWLSNNPTLRPDYVVLFQSLPQEVDNYTNGPPDANDYAAAPSVQCQLHYSTSPGWYPFVTAINMNGTSGTNFQSSDGTNDCIAYINKIITMASNNPPGTLFVSATAHGYSNINWYFDYTGDPGYIYYQYATNAQWGVTNVAPWANVIGTSGTNQYGDENFTAQATNVAGYFTGGWDGATGGYNTNDGYCFVDGSVRFFGNSGWFLMTTIDSLNGQRVTFQAGYLTWFATNSLGGTNYSNTPIGAVTTVNEPGLGGKPNSAVYYSLWAAGKSFALSAWDSELQKNLGLSPFFQAIGDPFVKK